jgi:NCAIR mutase (PurE)-related protein
MDKEKLAEMLHKFRRGDISEESILKHLADLPYEDVNFARIDHHRTMRWGFPEVIFCQGKTPHQVRTIAEKIAEKSSNMLATRANKEIYEEVRLALPDSVYNESARTISLIKKKAPAIPGKVMIITAGTTDLPMAGEAIETAKILGLDASIIADVGVAGIHRVFDTREEMEKAAVIIVIAGMEGALASVVAGMVQAPVIAVPSSVGYGASFNGITPLLSMLTSCVPGIAVMNIDNGFGAAFLAFRILKTTGRINKDHGKDNPI